ncbi:MAG: Transposase protein [Sphingobacteriales bacterium]|nr:Transposase protein [Sphingobacteriales bacterium]
MSANLKIISDLKNFIALSQSDSELKNLFTTSAKHFTRKRKLHFEQVVLILLNFFKKSYDIEIAQFYDLIGTGECSVSKSAFSQQRLKIHSLFFKCLNMVLVDSFYIHYQDALKRWNGFRIIAVDGSTAYLINKEEVTGHFGTHGNQRGTVTLGRILSAFDVLNNITIKTDLYPINQSEQKIAVQWLPSYHADMLLVYDRAYPGFASIFHHQNKEQPQSFLMRCPVGFNNEIVSFVKSGSNDAISTFKANKGAVSELRSQGFIVPLGTDIPVRLIKVVLDDGTTEVLVTNLFDKEKYPYIEFKELYFMRRGIETRFGSLKNQLQLEAFSGQKVETILQDFYITFFLSNLQEIISKPTQPKITEVSLKRKYSYQINKNTALGLMKNRIVNLFISSQPEEILVQLQNLFSHYLEPVRPNRKVPRIKKLKRRAGKYQALTNYKRAM